jgi:hypothetical protein
MTDADVTTNKVENGESFQIERILDDSPVSLHPSKPDPARTTFSFFSLFLDSIVVD